MPTLDADFDDVFSLHNIHYRRLTYWMARSYREDMSRLGAYVSLFAALSGCGYTSSYVPPMDGRARVVWDSSDSEATVSLSGGSLSRTCQGALRQLTGHERIPIERSFVQLPALPSPVPYQVPMSGSEYYVPRYYGPDILVVHPGVVPQLPHPPLFVPRLVRLGTASARFSPSVGGGIRGVSVGHSGGSSGSSGDAGKALAIVAVIAIVVMPVISISLASVRPESERQASQAIDAANAYNDMVRGGGSPCEADAAGVMP